MRYLWLLLILVAVPAFGQGARIGDNFPITLATTPGGPISAAMNAVVAVCTYPANAVPCTNKATTYTDITLGTSCSTNTQLVLAGTNSCVGTSDGYGNWGAWVSPAVYSLTITLSSGVNLGPYTITVSGLSGIISVAGPTGITATPSGNNVQLTLSQSAGGGNAVLLGTLTNPQTNDVISINNSGIIANQTLGIPPTVISTTPVALSNSNRGQLIVLESGAINLTIPQAGTAGLLSNVDMTLWNFSAVAVTLTPATSTVNGASSAKIPPGTSCLLTSDNTNYYLACSQAVSSSNATAPTVAAAGCGGAAASIASNNGTAAFKVNVGTSNGGSCTVVLPTAPTDWLCQATDVTTTSTTVALTKSVPTSGHLTTEITLQNYTDIAGTHAWVDSDIVAVTCSSE